MFPSSPAYVLLMDSSLPFWEEPALSPGPLDVERLSFLSRCPSLVTGELNLMLYPRKLEVHVL